MSATRNRATARWMVGPFLAGLLLATALAGALRFARLESVPVSLYCDEAFSGYEAYCLLETGRDSRGASWPFFFDIFGKGWGEPLYIYLSMAPVALFGLSPLGARFVAALAGTLAVPVTGLMTAALLRWPAMTPSGSGDPALAARAGTCAAFLMALSPWPFHFSRIAFQASLLPLALAAGFWLAAEAVSERRERVGGAKLAAAAALLGLSFYTYTIARVAVPLLVAGFVWIFRRRLAGAPGASKASITAVLILAALAAPIAGFSMTERGRQRFGDVSILSSAEDVNGPARIAARVASNYVSYYSPRFLLTEGDPNPRHSIRGHGILHPHDLILLALGVVACLMARRAGPVFLLWWLLVFPVAASLTVNPRHAVRAICGQPVIYAVAGLGAAHLWALARRPAFGPRLRLASAALLGMSTLAAGLSVVGYFNSYFTEYPIYSGPAWQYGLKEAYSRLESLPAEFDSIYVTRNEDFPYVHFLFYQAFPPARYQARRLQDTRYLFDQEVFYRGARIPNRLKPAFLLKPDELPGEGVEARETIKYPDGADAFVIAW